MNKGYLTTILRHIIGRCVILIGISAVAGMLTFNKARLPTENRHTLASAEIKIPSVSLEQMQDEVAEGRIICIDARSSAEFGKGHVPGAISLPFSEFDQSLAMNLELFLQKKPIIIYCGGEGCDLSHLLARKLFKLGIDQISVFTEGWDAWKSAGLPIDS